ncbi:MAG: chromosome segregation protein SMC [Gemmatimonadales bacterium]|jgi:chromosome segregation protein
MKLVGIEFHGFKSFADSADIRFHEGITAIVGPNGCGKSNISDGLRWVLGEQRPTAIRGLRMDEAIFQGTERRKAIHRAEVTLRLSNEDHLLPVPYSDVVISRTVHTGGEGEYRLNGTLCRLRDIQDLCRDTGLGTNAYAIIEGRMIDAILSDKAEERRAMFEEAAGIGRYKERRRIASRRLDEADADLARISDLVSEVQTKVRSLARQRGKARRFIEMRERKLALELGLAEFELARLQQRHHEIAADLRGIEKARVHDATQLRTAEAEHEAAKTGLADLERERAEAARRLMTQRDRLAERERERLLAEERARHASARLDQLAEESRELESQRVQLRSELEQSGAQAAERRSALQALRENLRREEVALVELGEKRQAMEAAEAAVESEQDAYREEKARLQAARDAARAEAAELGRRLDDAQRRLGAAGEALEAGAAEETEARRAAEEAQVRWQEASAGLEDRRRYQSETQGEREDLRGRQAAIQERLQAVSARIEELLPLAQGERGFNPAVQAALERAEQLGIRAVLARCIDVPAEFADGVEAYLGAFMEGLVVDDSAAVERVRRWFRYEYSGPGGLVVLPLDQVRGQDAPQLTLPLGMRVSGPGAPWLHRLLSDVKLASEGGVDARAWIGRRESRDGLGVVRFGRPYAGAGVLARKAELEVARRQQAELEAENRRVAALLGNCEARASSLTAGVAQLEAERRRAEEEVGRLTARAEAVAERLLRARQELEELGTSSARLESERAATIERGRREEEALTALAPAGTETAPDPEELARVRAEWEEARERVTRLQLDEARAAAALEGFDADVQAERSQLEKTDERHGRLAQERDELKSGLAQAREESETAARDLESFFDERSRLEEETRELEERAAELRQKVADLEVLLRRVQQEERGHAERRHELELERTQIDAELHRTRERLEDEWGRSYDRLRQEVESAEGEPDELRAELTETAERLANIGLVNMLAESEFQEEKERLEFLESQRADLVKARDDLRSTIREVNETASAAFQQTMEQIRVNFKRTFQTLFEGGECDVWLEDGSDPLDSPIEISASPRGKKTQRIHLLSGGERALTALSLLFAIYLVKPSPFCILDEVDAPLDETNILRFVAMLEEFKPSVQFIVITHNPVTIEAADWIYGVTMEEPGVSKIVGVEFSDYARGAVA